MSSKEAVDTNFKVIGLARLRIKPEYAAPEADALTTRPPKPLKRNGAELANLKTIGSNLNVQNGPW